MRAHVILCSVSVVLLAMNTSALVAREAPLLTKEFVDTVNRLSGGMWTAVYDGRMQNTTVSEAKRLNRATRKPVSVLPRVNFTEEELLAPLPETFDAAEKWPNCPTITEISDQSSCGSCWAVAAATSMTDRYCTIHGVRGLRISAADLLACCGDCGYGCLGGDPDMAWAYFSSEGIASGRCQPYPFPRCSHYTNSTTYPQCSALHLWTPTCNPACTDSTISKKKYRGLKSYSFSGEEDFRRELYFRGPFQAVFDVWSDLFAYKHGVYKHVGGAFIGAHAVRIVGWGNQSGVPYWKIANSWNAEWGDRGYFFMLRGDNECGIEDSGSAGVPAIPNAP
uniref:Cathepsin B-like protease n=1 Tax=Trypanosoma congolense TaxID=5692 RepID=B2C328_TRYCO|nr:cathepsin B-like protease [Trypanosoma congolense]